VKLNLGCASRVVDGWINVDYALGARLAKVPLFRLLNRKLRIFDLDWDERIHVHDLSKPFPWADDTTDVVYSSHALEYLSREEGRRFIAECHRVLRKNGIIRLVQHDLRYIASEYLEGRIRADDFAERLGVVYGSKKSTLKDRLAPLMQFPLKCVYDSSRLLEILREEGFEAEAHSKALSTTFEMSNSRGARRMQSLLKGEGASYVVDFTVPRVVRLCCMVVAQNDNAYREEAACIGR